MFLPESSRCISNGCMKSSLVVIRYLSMDSKYEMFSCFVLFRVSEFQFEFTVVGFLCSILPRRSLRTHRDENMIHLEKCHNRFTRIFWSLIRMKIVWYDSSSFCYGIFYSFEYEFFRMRVTESISYNFFREVIKDSSKIEVYSLVDNMSKVTSPNNIGMNRTKGLKVIYYFNSSNIFPMHIILFLVSRFGEFSSFFHESRYTKLLHESSCFCHWPTKRPANTTMTIPRMLFMNNVEFLFLILISYIHHRTTLKWWSGNRKYTREDTITYRMESVIMIFLVYLSHEVGLLHLFFSLAQQQRWVIR